jgi:uncharacterized membrane protein (DUF106 family)
MTIQEIISSNPLYSIILFSLVITFFLTLAYKLLIPQDKMKSIKERTKEIQAKIKLEKDTSKAMDLQKEMLQCSAEQMKLSLKPMLITYLPLILIFMLLRNVYSNTGDIISWGTKIPIIGTGAGWLVGYIVFSLIFSIVLRKIMKVQ